MGKFVLLFFLVIISSLASAQDRNSIWCFGDSVGIDFSDTLNPIPIVSSMDSRGSCVSYSDSDGILRLYSATMPYYGPYGAWATKVFNGQNQILAADSITGEAWYSELILLPKPNSDSLLYLFSIGIEQNINQGLYLSVIDLTLNGGGQVIQQNLQIDNYLYGDCLTAIRHGNGRDWWIMGKYKNLSNTFKNRFICHLVSPSSISNSIITDFNDAYDETWQKIIWHPSHDKFMLIHNAGYMSEFNFDRCTSIITLNRNIYPEQLNNFTRIFWEGAYSPNGDVFYISRTSYGGNYGDYNYLLQYDLTAANIPASCDTLDSTMYPPVDCGAVRLAPDGKIYYSQAYISTSASSYPYADSMRNSINENLGVVNSPDVVGNGCNFQPFSFYLGGKRTYYGLPNNPSYSLGPAIGSGCDTIFTSTTTLQNSSAEIMLAPNPATGIIYFNAKHIKGKSAEIIIRNSIGEAVYQKTLSVFNGGYATTTVNVQGFDVGVYLISLQTEREYVMQKFVKE